MTMSAAPRKRRPGRQARVPGALIRRVTIEMTEEEWLQIKTAAKQQEPKQSASDFVRLVAVGAADEVLEESRCTAAARWARQLKVAAPDMT